MNKKTILNISFLKQLIERGNYKIAINYLLNLENFNYSERSLIIERLINSNNNFYKIFINHVINKKNVYYDRNLYINKEIVRKFKELRKPKKYLTIDESIDNNVNIENYRNSKYFPFSNVIKAKVINKETCLLAVFDYETYNVEIEENVIIKNRYIEINPLLISYIIWISTPGRESDGMLIKEETLSFYVDSGNKDEINKKHCEVIIQWIEIVFSLLISNKIDIIYIWAHNFSRFDSKFIENIIPILPKDYRVRILLKDNKYYSINITFKEKSINFICRQLLLNRRLANLRKSFKLEFEKVFFPYDIIRINNWNIFKIRFEEIIIFLEESKKYNNDEINSFKHYWIKSNSNNIMDYYKYYCKIDVIILKGILISFFMIYNKLFNKRISYGYFITASRLRLITFLNPGLNFYKNNLISIRSKREIDKFIRTRYFGGRCEIYKGWNNKGNVYYYDFPGIYRIAITFKLPVGEPLHLTFKDKLTRKEDIMNVFKILEENDLIAFIRVKTFHEEDKRYIPILPIKKVNDEFQRKLIFCFGSNNRVYFSEELKLFIKYDGEVTELIEIIVFKTGYPLKEYSEFNLKGKNESKKNNDKVIETLYKLLNNRLYGKFAIIEPDRKWLVFKEGITLPEGIRDLKSTKYLNNETILLNVFTKKDEWYVQDKSKINVAVASAISSYGRIILTQSILNIKEINPEADLLYCDTDRIFWDRKDEIVCKNIYNNLRWESQKIYKDRFFLARKIYKLVDMNDIITVKRKGVKSEKINLEELENLKRGKGKIFTTNNIQWIKLSRYIPLIRSISKVIDPFKSTKRKLLLRLNKNNEEVWNGITKAFINYIKQDNYDIAQEKMKKWLDSNCEKISIGNRPFLKDIDFFSTINLRKLIVGTIEYNGIKIRFDIIGNILNPIAVDVKLLNLSIYVNNNVSTEKIFKDIYWMIIHIWYNNHGKVKSVGLILRTPVQRYTLGPRYIYTYEKLCLIGPDNFYNTLKNYIEGMEEQYLGADYDIKSILREDYINNISIRFIILKK